MRQSNICIVLFDLSKEGYVYTEVELEEWSMVASFICHVAGAQTQKSFSDHVCSSTHSLLSASRHYKTSLPSTCPMALRRAQRLDHFLPRQSLLRSFVQRRFASSTPQPPPPPTPANASTATTLKSPSSPPSAPHPVNCRILSLDPNPELLNRTVEAHLQLTPSLSRQQIPTSNSPDPSPRYF